MAAVHAIVLPCQIHSRCSYNAELPRRGTGRAGAEAEAGNATTVSEADGLSDEDRDRRSDGKQFLLILQLMLDGLILRYIVAFCGALKKCTPDEIARIKEEERVRVLVVVCCACSLMLLCVGSFYSFMQHVEQASY